MQTPLIKEIYLHTYILYIGSEKFFFFAIIGNFSTHYFNILECNFSSFYWKVNCDLVLTYATKIFWLSKIYQIFQHGLQWCYLILLSKILIIYIQKNLLLAAAFIGLFFSFLTTLLPYYCRLVIGAIIHHQGRTWYTVMCKHLKKVQFEEISKAKINIFQSIFFLKWKVSVIFVYFSISYEKNTF